MRLKRMLIALTTVGAISVIYTGIASAYCGPGFSNKSEAVSYYQGAGAKFLPSLKNELVADGFMPADQDALAFLQSDKVVNVVTPKGYKLSKNTYCSGSTYKPFAGLLVHSGKNVLAEIVGKTVKKLGKAKVVKTVTTVVGTTQSQQKQPDGSVKVYQTTTYKKTVTLRNLTTTCTLYKPFMKGYCRNEVSGKPFKKCATLTTTYKQNTTYKRTVLLKTIPPTTTTPTGSCNAIDSPGAVVCSTFYVIVTCGAAQITINGATAAEAIANANQYVAQNCTTPPTTTPTPTCTPPSTGTFPFCSVPTPTPHACTLSWTQDKTFTNVVYASVNTGSEMPASVTYVWGDGASNSIQATQTAHTYTPLAAGGSNVTYQIHAVATFGDGQTRDCGTLPFTLVAPPPSGNTGSPPAP
ncbi:MAG TPA: hypothetical protein VMT23_02535 [Candidatus Binatia bacterium]|nr:hypothetical protein [Candidatus Binatia bacterium]